jgi:hypothetical protein
MYAFSVITLQNKKSMGLNFDLKYSLPRAKADHEDLILGYINTFNLLVSLRPISETTWPS